MMPKVWLFSEHIIYSINIYPPAIGMNSLIEHMHQSIKDYDEQLVDVVSMANEDGSFASAKFRFVGKYCGNGKDFGLELKHTGHKYDLLGYNFIIIEGAAIVEIKAFFNEDDLKAQILSAEALLDAEQKQLISG